MTHWTVCTPQYTTYHGVWGDPPEPPETGADCVAVDAPTRRAAKIAAVRELRRTGSEWMQDQASDGASPFTGLEVFPATCEHGGCWCDNCTASKDWIECPYCLAQWEAEEAS